MNKREELEKVRKEMEADRSLPLVSKPEDVIPGDGNPDAEIMFIGEAGGYHEHVQRRPFVGQAGQLLNKLLESINLKREEVYISNMVKTRPPENRDPLPGELKAFGDYLDREIEIIEPGIIVTLGRFSMAKFIPDVTINRVHGKTRTVRFKGRDIVVIPMYHPAAALRRGEILEQLREDFKVIKKVYDDLNKPKEEKLEQMRLI